MQSPDTPRELPVGLGVLGPAVAGVAERAPDALRRRESVYRRLLALADLLAASGALLVSFPLAGAAGPTWTGFVALPLVVLVSKLIGLYDRDELLMNKSTLEETPALFQLATLYAFVFYLGRAYFVDGRLVPSQAALAWLTLFVLLLAARTAARGIARAVTPAERCLFVGAPEIYVRVAAKLARTPRVKTTLIGRVPLADEAADDGAVGDGVASLPHLAVAERIDRVIVAPRATDDETLLELLWTIKALGLRVSVFPGVSEVIRSSVAFDEVEGVTLLGIRRFGLSRSSRLVKRAFDLVGAVFVLAALAPLMALFAAAICLDSSRPALYRQVRVGREGRQFRMLKFRTMRDNSHAEREQLAALNESQGLFKIADDPRLTRVGRWLRRTSLDELPQLWNVLRGEMSLVGPRPLVAEEDRQITGWHRRRLNLTPGMTGHWQVLGSARIPLSEMLTIDYLYIANWSLWNDIKILLRTVPHVLSRRGM